MPERERARRVKLPIAAALLLLLALLPAPATGAAEPHRVWVGPITHDLVYTAPSLHVPIYRAAYGGDECHGVGVGTVHVDLAAGKFELVNPDSACVPGFTTLGGGCHLDADGHVRCERDGANFRIRADIAPDGAFVFTYDTPTFHELIVGDLERVA